MIGYARNEEETMIRGRWLVCGALMFALATQGCHGDEPTEGKQPEPQATVAAVPAPPAAPATVPAEATPERPVRSLPRRPDDRDPFLNPAVDVKPPDVIKPPPGVKFHQYALDELKLTAIVDGPDTQARAMFRGPTGVAASLGRGDRVSRAAARVKAILADRVVLTVSKGKDREQQAADLVIRL